MLSPTDIRPAVEAVLRNTDNSLSSYQILDRLPTGLRDLIIVERGWPGAGSGNSYSAASLVTDAVEGLLPSMQPPYRTYIDTGNATFQVAGKTIMAGNAAIAFYRLPDQSPSSLGPSDLHTSSSLSLNADQGDVTPLRTVPKLHWFEKPGLLALSLLFWPIFLLGMYYNGKAAIAANRTPWYEKTELLIISLLFFPLLFMGIFSSRKISGRGKLIAAGILLAMVTYPQIQIIEEGRRTREAEAHQAQAAATLQAPQTAKEKEGTEEIEQYSTSARGRKELAALRQSQMRQGQLRIGGDHAVILQSKHADHPFLSAARVPGKLVLIKGFMPLPSDSTILVTVNEKSSGTNLSAFQGQTESPTQDGHFTAGPFGPKGGLVPGYYSIDATCGDAKVNRAFRVSKDGSVAMDVVPGTNAAPGMAFEVYLSPETYNVEMVRRALISHPELVNSIDDSGATPAIIVAERARSYDDQKQRESRLSIVRALLRSGALVDAQDSTGHTALWFAASSEDYQLADLLLADGANVNKMPREQLTPYDVAGDDLRMKKLLSSRGGVPSDTIIHARLNQ